MTFYWLIAVHLVIILILTQKQAVGVGDPLNKDVYYTAIFSEDVIGCSEFDNQFMMLDLHVASSDSDPSNFFLQGSIVLNGDITPLHKVSVSLCKLELSTCEPVYATLGIPCETLNDTTTPWYPLFAAFNRKECDILEGTYKVDNLEISLEYAQEYLSYQFVAEYVAIVKVLSKEEEDVACYEMNIIVEEKQD